MYPNPTGNLKKKIFFIIIIVLNEKTKNDSFLKKQTISHYQDPLNGEAAALMLKQEEKYKAKVAGLNNKTNTFF